MMIKAADLFIENGALDVKKLMEEKNFPKPKKKGKKTTGNDHADQLPTENRLEFFVLRQRLFFVRWQQIDPFSAPAQSQTDGGGKLNGLFFVDARQALTKIQINPRIAKTDLATQALDQIGFFDEGYFMYGEDIDLSYRFLKADEIMKILNY